MPSCDAGLVDGLLHVLGDPHELAPLGGLEGAVDGVGFHDRPPGRARGCMPRPPRAGPRRGRGTGNGRRATQYRRALWPGRTSAASARSAYVNAVSTRTERGRRRPMVLSHVAVAVARELDDPPPRAGAVRELLAVDDRGLRHVQHRPPGVAGALLPVDLVRVHEELRVHRADLLEAPRRAPACPPTAPSRPRAVASPGSAPSGGGAGTARPRARRPRPGSRQAEGCWSPAGSSSRAPATPRAPASARAPPRSAVRGAPRSARSPRSAAGSQRPRARAISSESFSALPRRRSSSISSTRSPKRSRTASAVPSREALSSTSTSNGRRRRVARTPSPGSASRSSRASVLTMQMEIVGSG